MFRLAESKIHAVDLKINAVDLKIHGVDLGLGLAESKIKPCVSQYKLPYGETATCSLKEL